MTIRMVQPLLGIILLGAFFSAVSIAEARTVVRTGDLVSITEDQVVEGDFYTVARKVNISGEATEDVVAAAWDLTVNGVIGDNVFLFADEVDINGTIGDDVRVIARVVDVTQPVMGDALIIADTVYISSSASIAGDLLVYAKNVVVEGSVGGDVLGTVQILRIDGAVAGDMDVTVGQLTLGDRTTVDGRVTYESNELLIRGTEAIVSGDLVRNDPVLPGNEASIRLALIPSILLLFGVLVWYLVARKSLRATVDHALIKSPRPFFVGLLVVLFSPVAIAILIFSIIGILVGVAALFMYLLLIAVALMAATAVVGQLAMRAIDHTSGPVGLVALCVGVVIMTILMLLPYIGQLVFALLFIVAIGSMTDLLFRTQH